MALTPSEYGDAYESAQYLPNYAYSETTYWRVEKKGNVVTLHGNVLKDTMPYGQNVLLFTLDAKYKPAQSCALMGVDGVNGRFYAIDISGNTGEIKTYLYGTGNATCRCNFTITYITN